MPEENRPIWEWVRIKLRLLSSRTIFNFKEGEIWWAAVGKNIGIEINGKGRRFSRPVLIYKKLSKLGFFGIPLTTQSHGGNWYVPIVANGRHAYAVLSQFKTMSVFRLYSKLDELTENELQLIENAFIELVKRS